MIRRPRIAERFLRSMASSRRLDPAGTFDFRHARDSHALFAVSIRMTRRRPGARCYAAGAVSRHQRHHAIVLSPDRNRFSSPTVGDGFFHSIVE